MLAAALIYLNWCVVFTNGLLFVDMDLPLVRITESS